MIFYVHYSSHVKVVLIHIKQDHLLYPIYVMTNANVGGSQSEYENPEHFSETQNALRVLARIIARHYLASKQSFNHKPSYAEEKGEHE